MNEVENKMELFVYKGEFNLPSIDFDCLRVLVSFLIQVWWKSLIISYFL